MAGACGFWQPRRTGSRAPTETSARCRPTKGLRTSAVLRPPPITINFQVETFKLFGKLKKTETEVHNSLPSLKTIQTEKTLLDFEEQRRQTPDGANYGDFYRSLTSSITSSRAPSAVTFTRSNTAITNTTTRHHPKSNVDCSRTRSAYTDARQSIGTRGSGTGIWSVSSRTGIGLDKHTSLDSRSGTRASNATGPLSQDGTLWENKLGALRGMNDSPSARSLIHIHGIAVDHRQNSKAMQSLHDTKQLAERRKSRHEEVDTLLLEFLERDADAVSE